MLMYDPRDESLHYGTGNETDPDPAHMLPKASQEALHPDAATLVLELHHGYTIRMVRVPSTAHAPQVPSRPANAWKNACMLAVSDGWCAMRWVVQRDGSFASTCRFASR